MTAFSDELTALREKARMSRAELATTMTERLGKVVSVRSISGWETGEYEPRDRATVLALDVALAAQGVLIEMQGYLPESRPLVDHVAALQDEVRALARLVEERLPAPPSPDTPGTRSP